MNARERILSKIRNAQLRAQTDSTEGHVSSESIREHLLRHPRGPQPSLPDDLIENFKQRAIKLSSDVLQTTDIQRVPALVAQYLNERQLPIQGICWPMLAKLPWGAAGLDILSRPANGLDGVGITGSFCAIAETGTLMMLSGTETPATASLLPETHIAILDPRRVVATMEDAWELMRKEHSQPPRAVNFISGPSRTADIEMTVTMGAHGPYRVLVILAPLT